MAVKLLNSFGAVYALLEKPLAARRALAILLVTHTLLLGYSAYVHSPTLNEPAHLVAGLSHWKFGRFELYRVNPPLVRMVAALPVIAAGYREDWTGYYEGLGARPEIEMGAAFVKANGERSFFLIMIARWACIPFSWIGAIGCYLWARDLYGRPAGVMAATIWCFEPNVLAHASLLTPDAHAAALGLLACYTFWRWLRRPTWSQAATTGVVLGLAELAKTTLILFYPLWPLLWLIYRWPERHRLRYGDWLREVGMLAMRMVIGLYVLQLGYAFEGSLTPLKDFEFVSDLFTGPSALISTSPVTITTAAATNSQVVKTKPPLMNRVANSWLGYLPAPFPKNYLLGIDLQQRDFEHYERPSYLGGVWQERGWWYYYLYACAIKLPLGLWLLGFVAIVTRSSYKSFPSREQNLSPAPDFVGGTNNASSSPTLVRDEFILVFPGLAIFAVVSSKSGFSEHLRYVLPAFPYFFIWVSRLADRFAVQLALAETKTSCKSALGKHLRPRWASARKLLTDSPRLGYNGPSLLCPVLRPFIWKRPWMLLVPPIVTAFCVVWSVISSLWIYPHSLSYFNEAIGGPLSGAQYLLGSNVDWGQDLRYLARWMDHRPDRYPVFVSTFNNFDPHDLEIATSGMVPIRETLRFSNSPDAWFVLSRNFVTGGDKMISGKRREKTHPNDNYCLLFKQETPTTHVGYSLQVYGGLIFGGRTERNAQQVKSQ